MPGIRLAAIALSIAIVLFLADWALSIPASCYQQQASQQSAAEQSCAPFQGPLFAWAKPAIRIGAFFDVHAGAVAALSTVFIALFTIVLVWATSGRFAAADKQAADLAESLRVAEDAANAAKESADAAVKSAVASVESAHAAAKSADAAVESADAAVKSAMPILFPLITDSSGLLPTETDSADRHVPSIDFILENYGKTPAIITKLVYELCLGSDMPESPPWENHVLREDTEIIPGETRRSEFQSLIICRFHRPITAAEIAELRINAAPESPDPLRFFLYGYVIYDDVFGYSHIQGFARKIIHGSSINISPQASGGGSKYEYYHRIDRRDNFPG